MSPDRPPLPRRRPVRGRHRGAVARAVAFVALAGLAGCATGPRPRLMTELSTTGSDAADAVLSRLDQIGSAVYAAEYDVTSKFDGHVTSAVVTQSAPDRRSLTVGDIRYLVDGGSTSTCDLAASTCTGTLDATRISDVPMTPDFFGTSARARLRADVAAATAAPVGSNETIDGREATCVDVPVAQDTNRFCVFDDGVVASLEAGDVSVVLVAYADEADEAQFEETISDTTPSDTSAAADATQAPTIGDAAAS